MKKIAVVLGIVSVIAIAGVCLYFNRDAVTSEGPVVEGPVENSEPDTKENVIRAEAVVNGPYGSMQLSIPETWEYEICQVDAEELVASSYGIHLKPSGEAAGWIEVGFSDSFGVCGTGLETKSVLVAGSEAHIGYYDGKSNWDFIKWIKEESLRNISVLCYAEWGERYLDELLEILDTIRVDENNQTGGIGVYRDSSGIGINDGHLTASVRNVRSTGATLVFDYSVHQDNGQSAQDELYFGSCLPIAKRVGGGFDWVELEYIFEGTPAFPAVVHVIGNNEETVFEYDWEPLYGKLEPGEYRITVLVNSELCVYAYFILR